MRATSLLLSFTVLAGGALSVTAAQETPRLLFRRFNSSLELSWPGTINGADGSTLRPYFELQRSFDLRLWQPLGGGLRAAGTIPGRSLSMTLALDQPQAFYRLFSIRPNGVGKLGNGGAEVFGYAEAFAQELQRVGQISVAEFVAMFPNDASYLPGIS